MHRKPTYEELFERVKELEQDALERMWVEKALQESKEHFRKLAEGSFEAIVLHKKGVILKANNQYYEMFGYNPDELAGKDAISLTAIPESVENIKKQISLGNFGPYEVTGVKKDGTKFPMEIRIKLTSHKGHQVRMAVIRDLTGREEMAKEVRDAKQKWVSLVENTNDFIMVIDDKGKIRYINRALAPHTVDQVTGKTLYDFSVPENHEMIKQAVARVFETREQGSYTSSVKHPAGVHWFETTMIPIIEEDKVRSVLSFNKIITEKKQAEEALRKAHDELNIRVNERTAELLSSNEKLKNEIDERKKSEEALRESESKLSAMLASMGDHMSMMDKDLNILWTNEIAENIFGNDIIGKKCYEVYHKRTEPCEPYPCITLRAFQNGTMHKHDTQVIDKDGTTIFYHCTANVALRDEEGKPTAVLEISRDITERFLAEQAMKTHLKVKEMLLSEIHHRVKNNLEIIASLLDLSSMNTGDREIQKTLSDIRSRIFSMALIHTQLYENNRFDKIDMEIYVQKMLNYLSDIYGDNEKPINFVIEASEMHLSLNQAIPSALALNEIITNSFKHAFRESKQGTINVCMKNTSDDTVFMSVKDDGIGISKGIDFNSTKGIGLNLVKHLIENQLKGEVRVNPNDGTEFSLEFKRLKL